MYVDFLSQEFGDAIRLDANGQVFGVRRAKHLKIVQNENRSLVESEALTVHAQIIEEVAGRFLRRLRTCDLLVHEAAVDVEAATVAEPGEVHGEPCLASLGLPTKENVRAVAEQLLELFKIV